MMKKCTRKSIIYQAIAGIGFVVSACALYRAGTFTGIRIFLSAMEDFEETTD